MTPTYGGNPIFGTAVVMRTSEHPRDAQLNAFFGVNGLERLDGGDRGGETTVAGWSIGTGVAGLNAAEALFRSFRDGVSRPLADNLGRTWPNVVLETFMPQGKIRQSPNGLFLRQYEAKFSHL